MIHSSVTLMWKGTIFFPIKLAMIIFKNHNTYAQEQHFLGHLLKMEIIGPISNPPK